MIGSTLQKLMGFGVLAVLTAHTGSPAAAQERQSEEPPVANQDELADPDVVLRVDGMSCPFCAYGLEKRLLENPGIARLVVRVSDGLVLLRLVEGSELTDEELREAVDKAGFSLREVRREDP